MMAKIFKDKKIKEKLENFEIPKFKQKLKIVKDWHQAYQDGKLQDKTESQCEQAFNQDFFINILDYESFPKEIYSIDPKGATETSGQKPDAILGYFGNETNKVQAVVEIKDANTELDKSQKRQGNLSPIQQAFKYKPQYKECNFVIATNFYEIRLHKDNQLDYEVFTLESLLEPKDDYFNFQKFYYLLNRENFVTKQGKTKTEQLLSDIRIEQEKITKEFYKEYKQLRRDLIKNIFQNNKQARTKANFFPLAVQKAQKIIDRIVFISFCEDRGLLPEDTLQRAIKYSENSFSSIWNTLKGLFGAIDEGSSKLEIPDGYNGELFKPDTDLDSLKIGDKICKKLANIGKYDFSEEGGDLSVNILGHIFEQSISDIEELKNVGSIEKLDQKQSKRKKDGIYYTPDYIVDYIVKNALGKYLEEKEEELKKKHKLKGDIQDKNYQKRAIKAYYEYQQVLQDVKVLDPACGSGAFLVKVFDYLLEENKRVGKILQNYGQGGLFNNEAFYKQILENNIYGVDLNQESVEITKLSLWLKTAIKGKKLTTLKDNIKCGNSLIDDPEVAGDKAFKWEEEYKTIMNKGGFDVVVGNPPYGVKFDKKTKDYLKKFDDNVPDYEIYIYFISKGLNILKDEGFLSYIFPNTFLSILYGKKYRTWILDNYKIEEIVNLSNDETFVDASVRTCITTFNKTASNNYETLFKTINPTSKNFIIKNKYNKEELKEFIENWLNLFILSKKKNKLINKLKKHKMINDFFDVSQGLIPYDKYRGHDEYTIRNRVYHADYKKNDLYKKELKGGDIYRYGLNWNGQLWIKYGDWLAAPREIKYFKNERGRLYQTTEPFFLTFK